MEATDRNGFKILIVDDNPRNIQVVGNLLSQEGYPTAFAVNGEQALEQAGADHFDLILLDVMMPGMDGFAVCEHLKKDEKTREIPIIFLTAKTDTESIVKGFDVGAFDYVTKPFIGRELLARVRSRLREKVLQDELKRRYEEIRRLETMRESLTHMILHDLKNPLSGITGYAGLLEMNPAVAADPKASAQVGSILNCARTMIDMTMAILDVSKMESGRMPLTIEAVALHTVLRVVVDGLAPHLERSSVEMAIHLPPDLPKLRADREILRRILVNLLGNAVRFSPKNGVITFRAERAGAEVRLIVSDQGPGIPEAFRERIFEKYAQVDLRESDRKMSTGLGLTFCKMAVEAHGGRIGVSGEPGNGSDFWLLLPAAAGGSK